MYVVCDNMRPLSEAVFCRGSFIESVLVFNRYFPGCISLNVYRDLYGRGDCADLQYIATLSAKNIQSLKAKYQPK